MLVNEEHNKIWSVLFSLKLQVHVEIYVKVKLDLGLGGTLIDLFLTSAISESGSLVITSEFRLFSNPIWEWIEFFFLNRNEAWTLPAYVDDFPSMSEDRF